MTRTWSQTARTALDGGRIWRDLVKERGMSETELGFRATDMIVLALLLDFTGAQNVVCRDAALCGLIDAVFSTQGSALPRRGLVAADGIAHLLLTPLGRLGQAAPTEAALAHVVYGLSGVLPLTAPADVRKVGLRLLAGSCPALWQSGLALVVTPADDAAAATLIGDVAQSMHGDWIDPLALYERVQVLTARLKTVGSFDEHGEAEPEGNRLAELERELGSLKRAALVSQHLLLVDAVERVRNPS